MRASWAFGWGRMMARVQLNQRKTLNESAILGECVGATCRAIAGRLGEDFYVVKRHLQSLRSRGLVVAYTDGGYLRYTKA